MINLRQVVDVLFLHEEEPFGTRFGFALQISQINAILALHHVLMELIFLIFLNFFCPTMEIRVQTSAYSGNRHIDLYDIFAILRLFPKHKRVPYRVKNGRYEPQVSDVSDTKWLRQLFLQKKHKKLHMKRHLVFFTQFLCEGWLLKNLAK